MSILTEREKWLMQKAWDNGINRTDCNDMQEWLDIVDYESMIESILRQAPKPESIVKKVDAYNLPNSEVLAFGQGEFLVGYLESYETDVTCEYEGMYLEKVTQYIELSDLEKLFEESK